MPDYIINGNEMYEPGGEFNFSGVGDSANDAPAVDYLGASSTSEILKERGIKLKSWHDLPPIRETKEVDEAVEAVEAVEAAEEAVEAAEEAVADTKKPFIMDDEAVVDIITELKETDFYNKQNRQRMVALFASLATTTNPVARKFIKYVSDCMSGYTIPVEVQESQTFVKAEKMTETQKAVAEAVLGDVTGIAITRTQEGIVVVGENEITKTYPKSTEAYEKVVEAFELDKTTEIVKELAFVNLEDDVQDELVELARVVEDDIILEDFSGAVLKPWRSSPTVMGLGVHFVNGDVVTFELPKTSRAYTVFSPLIKTSEVIAATAEVPASAFLHTDAETVLEVMGVKAGDAKKVMLKIEPEGRDGVVIYDTAGRYPEVYIDTRDPEWKVVGTYI